MKDDEDSSRETHSCIIQNQINENFLMRDIIQSFIDDKTKYYSPKSHLFMNEKKEKLTDQINILALIEKCNAVEFNKLITPKAPGSGAQKEENAKDEEIEGLQSSVLLLKDDGKYD